MFEVEEVNIIIICPYCDHIDMIDNIPTKLVIHNCGCCGEDYEVVIKLK